MINDLIVDKTYSTPKVQLLSKSGALKVEGRSIPENPSVFFEPIIDWLNEYFKNPVPSTVIDFKLDYINSGSSKSLLSILKLLKTYYDRGIRITINWHFEEDDESIRDLGKHYKSLLNMPFNLVEII
jgi:hypothetical protein